MGNIIQQKPWFGTLRKDPHWSTKNLDLYLPMRKAGRVVDFTQNRNHGSIAGATWQGAGLNFTGGGDLVTIPDNSTINPLGPFTVTLSMTPSQVASTVGVIRKHDANNARMHHWFRQVNDDIRFYVGSLDEGTPFALWPDFLVTGQRFFLVGVWDGTNTLLYVDGDFVAQAPNPAAPDESTTDLLIGGIGGIYEGDIDLYSMYSRALTASEIQQLHRNPDLPTQRPAIYGNVAAAPAGNNPDIFNSPVFKPRIFG